MIDKVTKKLPDRAGDGPCDAVHILVEYPESLWESCSNEDSCKVDRLLPPTLQPLLVPLPELLPPGSTRCSWI